MAKEEKEISEKAEKFEIEDIKGPEEDLDLEKAVAEDTAEETTPIEEIEKDPKPVEEVEPDDRDILEKSVEEVEAVPLKKIKTKKKFNQKTLLIILLAVLLTAAAVLGGVYYWTQKKEAEPKAEIVEDSVKTEEDAPEEKVAATKFVFINSEIGLNMREEPNASAKVLAIIPFGTKIEVLEEKSDWYKTEYESKQGWVSGQYTSEKSPLIYEDTTYGFKLTFKPSWAGYKFFEAKNSESTVAKTYYVAIPTTDTSWDESASGITKGYASLFVMGVYTKEEWAKLAGGEMLPAKLGESTKYVYTYLPGQAHPADKETQYSEINDIIKTFEVIK